MIFSLCSTPTMNRQFDVFRGWIEGSERVSAFHCHITILEKDPMNWRVMAYFPGDKPEDVMHFSFPVADGELLTEATARLAGLVRNRKIARAHIEYLHRVEDEEFSIEKDVPYASH